MNTNDVTVLRELGKRIAETAALSVNAETVDLWKRLNGLRPVRPMIMVDQLPWNELNDTGELTLQCEDRFCRDIECGLRQRLYQFAHFRGDMVMHNEVAIPRAVRSAGGIAVRESTLATEEGNSVVAHHFEDQIPDEAALESIPAPVITVDESLDQMHREVAAGIFDGIVPLRFYGLWERYGMHVGLWDSITSRRGGERVLYDLVDRPEFSLKLITTFAAHCNSLIDQYERLGLLDVGAPYIHCTGAYTDELPSREYDGTHAKAKDVWAFGLAQIFSTVSPEMHDEFEIQPMKALLERFGLLYYGCCDPLDRKIDIVRKLKNVRKISVSPWADPERSAEGMAGDFVFSAKPNPSYLAMESFDENVVRKELRRIVDVCKRHNTPCELILKDVSTVRHQPGRLTAWERIAREVAGAG